MKVFIRLFITVFVSIIFNSCITSSDVDKSASGKDSPGNSVSRKKIKCHVNLGTKYKTQKLQLIQFKKP